MQRSLETQSQIKIAVMTNRRIEVKDESGKTQCREVQYIWRAAALLKQNEEADEEIHDADQIDVDSARIPFVNRFEPVEICVVKAGFRRVRRALHQIMNLAADLNPFKIYLYVSRSDDGFKLPIDC